MGPGFDPGHHINWAQCYAPVTPALRKSERQGFPAVHDTRLKKEKFNVFVVGKKYIGTWLGLPELKGNGLGGLFDKHNQTEAPI